MKIRQGFVSNSSSSSFVLGFKIKPKSAEDVRHELFGDEPADNHITADYHDDALHIGEVASMVYEDIKNKKGEKISSLKAFAEHCSHGYFDGYPEFDHSNDKPHDIFEKEFHKKNGKAIQECEKSHPKEYKEWNTLWRKDFDKFEERVKEAANVFAKGEWPKFKNCKFIYSLEYGDSHGIRVNGILEHGRAWDRIPHTRISHH